MVTIIIVSINIIDAKVLLSNSVDYLL